MSIMTLEQMNVRVTWRGPKIIKFRQEKVWGVLSKAWLW